MADPQYLLRLLGEASNVSSGGRGEGDPSAAAIVQLMSSALVSEARVERIATLLVRAADLVAVENRVVPSGRVVEPIVACLGGLDLDSVIWELCETLLARAIHAELRTGIHPAFAQMVSQLADDEAVLISIMRGAGCQIIDYMELDRTTNRFVQQRIEVANLPPRYVTSRELLYGCYEHLQALGLAVWPVERQEPVKDALGKQLGVRRYSNLHLTRLGKAFAEACIPAGGVSAKSDG